MKLNILRSAAALLAAFALFACSKSNSWTVDGNIEGADGQTMVLEASTNGRWYPLDSVELGPSGDFKFSHAAAGYPDIYRLRLGDKSLYFPIDSIETVTVISKANAFDSDYTLAGTPAAELLMEIDRRLMESAGRLGPNNVGSDSLLKRDLAGQLLGDPAGIVSYYIINKKIGGVALFNPANRRDLRIIGAVANAFSEKRPGDPRTAFLRDLYVNNRNKAPRSEAAPRDTVVAGEVAIFNIALYDESGKLHNLTDVASKGHPVVLNFTAYAADASPAYNAALHRVYEKYHGRGLEIFQVSVDDDEFAWRQAAKNLPWITVYNSPVDGAQNLINYNVTALPVTYVIDSNGDLKERVATIDRLDAAVASAF